MKKIENELKQNFSTIIGNLLLIGNYSNTLEKIISNNKNITFCDQLTKNNNYTTGTKGKNKKINIKNIKKHYKKNKINNTVVNFSDVVEYKNTFVRDSIYITKNEIIIIDKENNDLIYKMYKRYCSNIEIINCLDGRIFKVNTNNYKNNKIKNIFYYLFDILNDILDIISNLL